MASNRLPHHVDVAVQGGESLGQGTGVSAHVVELLAQGTELPAQGTEILPHAVELRARRGVGRRHVVSPRSQSIL